MNTPDDFSQYHAELLDGIYDCVDRIVLNAFFPLGQTGGGMRSWWRSLHGDDSQLDDKHLREMAGTFSRRLHPGRSTLRQATRGTQPNLRNHRPCAGLRNSQHSDNMLAFVVRLEPRCSRGSQQPARIVDQSLWQSETGNLGLAHEPVVAMRTG